MQAGKLRHRIKIFDQMQSRSKTGAVAIKWEHILTIWGQFVPLSAKDVMTAKAAGSQTVARLIIRYRGDIHSGQRVEHVGKVYEIDGEPLADNRSGMEYLTVMLRSVA
ncbi:phage head-tail adaptor, putative, SPP1 family [Moraxella cuniculi DSM 21768]|uniref:Phage head-tail adaptor, putative, SPP1 family n=1 Tax=Moraxella cuniculi DSM 21768 TaxID=1122245 RepID=A0A1N7G6Z0_9GAMM|nr:phage head closure protein [Moraxella cuniculi]OOS04369.1 head-tail adaptor protein [Moraxella cuniculi]SIS08373.1 phage head-tail adaptor, putative, SPP1 family [Moraxella cuniculi DSM 21768]